ncbi:MAG: DsrE/DsrF/DrsH-like family protein [Deltaproteobacteria bacterium]|nr:DsrE/DsrF/DrsH-like family protein [Deltaproteobacteria bacterium]MBW2051360.1 DsrE/DsrF/DrsH-like family protein [Deltaproteobacteria bacterium]MBW2139985.1 DsrE/DsrF/DrsH-like family protein [Deltaproteobacteria bacterium]MBW2322653.1 DsrE/DsrF/DrsH-like family protein [Deltaproteobacteria bacterium]
MEEEKKEQCALICSRDSLEGAYPALVLGINACRMGIETKVFYTFMGLNVIRKGWIDKVKFNPPGALGAIPGMSSLATWMMKRKIEQANIPPLDDLQEMALLEGVQFIACQMTVDMMGLSQDDFIDGVVIQAAEEFMKYALDCKLSLFT